MYDASVSEATRPHRVVLRLVIATLCLVLASFSFGAFLSQLQYDDLRVAVPYGILIASLLFAVLPGSFALAHVFHSLYHLLPPPVPRQVSQVTFLSPPEPSSRPVKPLGNGRDWQVVEPGHVIVPRIAGLSNSFLQFIKDHPEMAPFTREKVCGQRVCSQYAWATTKKILQEAQVLDSGMELLVKPEHIIVGEMQTIG